MEPTKEQIAFVSEVTAIEEKFDKIWVEGIGTAALFKFVSKGWFVGLRGSYEWLLAGDSKPNINIGDIATVRIVFNAKPSESSKQ